VTFEEASVLPLALSTAADGLYQSSFLNLPLPQSKAPNVDGKGKVVLVWGGASSVGATAIQLALASGLQVISTASPSNFDFVKSLGASAVFDYRSSSVLEDLVAALEKDGLEFAGVYDAVSTPESVLLSAKVAKAVKGGRKFVATTLPPPKDLPEGVKAASGTLFSSVLVSSTCSDYLPLVQSSLPTSFLNTPDALPKQFTTTSFPPLSSPAVSRRSPIPSSSEKVSRACRRDSVGRRRESARGRLLLRLFEE
jgi:hypothetical protein